MKSVGTADRSLVDRSDFSPRGVRYQRDVRCARVRSRAPTRRRITRRTRARDGQVTHRPPAHRSPLPAVENAKTQALRESTEVLRESCQALHLEWNRQPPRERVPPCLRRAVAQRSSAADRLAELVSDLLARANELPAAGSRFDLGFPRQKTV